MRFASGRFGSAPARPAFAEARMNPPPGTGSSPAPGGCHTPPDTAAGPATPCHADFPEVPRDPADRAPARRRGGPPRSCRLHRSVFPPDSVRTGPPDDALRRRAVGIRHRRRRRRSCGRGNLFPAAGHDRPVLPRGGGRVPCTLASRRERGGGPGHRDGVPADGRGTGQDAAARISGRPAPSCAGAARRCELLDGGRTGPRPGHRAPDGGGDRRLPEGAPRHPPAGGTPGNPGDQGKKAGEAAALRGRVTLEADAGEKEGGQGGPISGTLRDTPGPAGHTAGSPGRAGCRRSAGRPFPRRCRPPGPAGGRR